MTIKRIAGLIVGVMQRILIFISLILIYFLGFGITLFFTIIFNRRVLTGRSKDGNSFWIGAEGYEADIEDSLRQS